MIGSIIAFSPAVLTMGAAMLLYRSMAFRIRQHTLTGRSAMAVYVLTLAFLPAVLMLLSVQIAFWALEAFPSARWPSWDVALTYSSGLGVILAYAIAVIAIAVGCRMLAVAARRESDARAT